MKFSSFFPLNIRNAEFNVQKFKYYLFFQNDVTGVQKGSTNYEEG